MRDIHIISNPLGSLGEITNDIVTYLGSKFKFTSEFDEKKYIPETYDILLSHFISTKVTESPIFHKFKYKILIQPIDGTKIYPKFIESINEYDLILTPGKAGKSIMEENGVIKPILVVPNYFKSKILVKPKDLSIPKLDKLIANKFIFYHESTCHPRKGIEEMCLNYVKTFSDTPYVDKVVLVIKASSHNELTYDNLEEIKKRIVSLQKQYKNPASIIKISQHLSEKTLKKLWYKTDCYLHFAKMEGFGIPLLRMAALGKPIITLYNGHSGYMDFLSNDWNAKFIGNKKVIAHNEFIPIYTKETEWSVPYNEKEVSDCLMDAYNGKIVFQSSRDLKFFKKYSVSTVMSIYEKIFENINMYKKEIKYDFIESDIEIIK